MDVTDSRLGRGRPRRRRGRARAGRHRRQQQRRRRARRRARPVRRRLGPGLRRQSRRRPPGLDRRRPPPRRGEAARRHRQRRLDPRPAQGAGVAAYAASKAALIQMTRQHALEWARHGIRVNALAPGYVETDLNRDFFATDAGAGAVKRIPSAASAARRARRRAAASRLRGGSFITGIGARRRRRPSGVAAMTDYAMAVDRPGRPGEFRQAPSIASPTPGAGRGRRPPHRHRSQLPRRLSSQRRSIPGRSSVTSSPAPRPPASSRRSAPASTGLAPGDRVAYTFPLGAYATVRSLRRRPAGAAARRRSPTRPRRR